MRAFLIIWGLPPTGPRAAVRPRAWRGLSSTTGLPSGGPAALENQRIEFQFYCIWTRL